MTRLWSTEPALVVGVVTALIALALAFGLPLSDQQTAAILGFVGAVLAIGQGVVTRTQVTPVGEP